MPASLERSWVAPAAAGGAFFGCVAGRGWGRALVAISTVRGTRTVLWRPASRVLRGGVGDFFLGGNETPRRLKASATTRPAELRTHRAADPSRRRVTQRSMTTEPPLGEPSDEAHREEVAPSELPETRRDAQRSSADHPTCRSRHRVPAGGAESSRTRDGARPRGRHRRRGRHRHGARCDPGRERRRGLDHRTRRLRGQRDPGGDPVAIAPALDQATPLGPILTSSRECRDDDSDFPGT